jgi:hypothetical protein
MSEAEHFLRDARKSFRLASDAIQSADVERYAGMGRDYLQLAHKAAKITPIKDRDRPPSWWNLP